MQYKNVTIQECVCSSEFCDQYTFHVVTENWLKPNSFRKDAVTNSLATIENTITYYLSEGAHIRNGIVFLGKGKVAM